MLLYNTGLNIEQGQSATYKLLMDGISSSPSPLIVTYFYGDRQWSVTNSTLEVSFVNGQIFNNSSNSKPSIL